MNRTYAFIANALGRDTLPLSEPIYVNTVDGSILVYRLEDVELTQEEQLKATIFRKTVFNAEYASKILIPVHQDTGLLYLGIYLENKLIVFTRTIPEQDQPKLSVLDVLRNTTARLILDDRWLVLNDTTFEVFQRKAYAQRTSCIYRGQNEAEALKMLLTE